MARHLVKNWENQMETNSDCCSVHHSVTNSENCSVHH
jgi:hypothetical protein